MPPPDDPGALASARSRPTTTTQLRDAVEELGAKLATCERRCAGIACDVSAGSMPRCLIFEPCGWEHLDGGVIVVGLNPGKADHGERRIIKELFRPGHDRRRAYAAYLAWLNNAIQAIPFYTLMRAALAALDFAGPILWTEIVKCESGTPLVVDGRARPVSFGLGPPFRMTTVRTCCDEHLRAELALCPPEWPSVAAGLGVGDCLDETRAELACTRPILAVPHPTGSENFLKTFIPSVVTTSDAMVQRARALTPSTFVRLSTGSSGS